MKKNKFTFRRSSAAVLLSFSMAFPLLSGLSVQAAGGTMEGDGSAGSPYLIQDEADLRQFATAVSDGSYDIRGKLTADIVISGDWSPIGGTDSASAYTGVFDGDGHTVTFTGINETSFQGLFGYSSGTIQDVKTTGTISAADYAGAIAAVNAGTISGCENQASVASSSTVSFAGGIAGVNIGTIEDSRNSGSVSSLASGSNLGGIAGAAREGTITGCSNTGTITLEPASADPAYNEGCAGGITGLNYKASIRTSGNYGAVSSTDTNGYTGGVAGLNNGSIASCANGETVTGVYYAGGIAGYNFLNEEAGSATIHNTLNHGSITPNETGYGAICGVNHEGTIYDSYYLEGTALAGIGTSDNNGTTARTASSLASGETAYQLNGNQSSSPVWYQTLTEDRAPVLDNSHGTVYRQSKDGEISYSNDPSSHTDHEFGEDGECGICQYKSVALYGHSLTLDGALGLNYYYYLDPMYYQDDTYTITATFTVNGRTETDTFDPSFVLATGKDDMPQVYGFQLYINSDEMTLPVQAKLEIKKEDKTIVSLSDEGTFRGYDYLTELYENKEGTYSAELQELARALATYDYYANEHFQYHSSYEPTIPLLPLDSVTAESVQSYTQIVGDQSGYTAKHYALSMQFLSEHVLYLYITSEEALDTDRLYLGYKTHGSEEDYTYVQAEKYGSYYRGATKKTPASELDTMWDCAFFLKQEDGSYQQITAIKTAGPLSYVSSSIRPDIKKSLIQLNQSLYLYHEATKTYFDSISQE